MSQEPLQTTTIIIQGKSYEMRCPDNEVHSLEHAAALLNDKIELAKQKTANPEKAAILAGLHLAHELYSTQASMQSREDEQSTIANNQISNIINNIYSNIAKKTD